MSGVRLGSCCNCDFLVLCKPYIFQYCSFQDIVPCVTLPGIQMFILLFIVALQCQSVELHVNVVFSFKLSTGGDRIENHR